MKSLLPIALVAGLACSNAQAVSITDTANAIHLSTCASKAGHTSRCTADTRAGILLFRQNGKCREGATWGRGVDHVWTKNGCVGTFFTRETNDVRAKVVYTGKRADISLDKLMECCVPRVVTNDRPEEEEGTIVIIGALQSFHSE